MPQTADPAHSLLYVQDHWAAPLSHRWGHCVGGAHRYVLPSLSMIPNDPEESARVQYASTIAALAARGKHFLTQAQLKSCAAVMPGLAPVPAQVCDIPTAVAAALAPGIYCTTSCLFLSRLQICSGKASHEGFLSVPKPGLPSDPQVKYELELAELRTAVEGVLHELVVGKLTSAATRQVSLRGPAHNHDRLARSDSKLLHLWNQGYAGREFDRLLCFE